MYKRIMVIGLLMGIPIFLLPAQNDAQTTDTNIEVAGLVQEAAPAPGNETSSTSIEPADSSSTTLASTTTQRPTTNQTPPTTLPPTTTFAPTTASAPTNTEAPATSADTAETSAAPTPTSTTIAEPTSTEAPPTTQAPAPLSPTERGQAALTAISYNWQGILPGWIIEFSPGRDGVIGYTYTYEKRIEVFVRDDLSEGLLRHVIAHEIGHAVDVSLNSSGDRERWQEARGIGGSPWWPGNGVSDYSTGAGDFAECFAVWQTGSGIFRSKIGSAPTGDQLAIVAELAGG